MPEYDYVKTKREDVKPMTESQQEFGKKIIKRIMRAQVWVFKKSKGRLWKNFPGGFPIMVIGTTGKKSGLRREIALIHVPYEDGVLMVGSQGGMDAHPVWVYNVEAHPDVDVMVGGEVRNMRARRLSDEEKAAVWPHMLKYYPDFDEYQARTDRNIRVYQCTPV